MMRRVLVCAALALASASALAEPFDCKPRPTLGDTSQASQTIYRSNAVGRMWAWRCNTGQLQMIVVRRDFVTTASLQADLDYFMVDPSMARMSSLLAKYQTADWRTDPGLREVWTPYQATLDALR